MGEKPDNIVIEYLRRIRDGQDQISHRIGQLEDRMSAVEMAIVSFKKEVAFLYEVDQRLQAHHDRMGDRLARVERRLDISDAPPPL